MPDHRYQQYCGAARALDVVGDRWTLLIVRELMLGPRRFTDLIDGLPDISRNLLTERLRALDATASSPGKSSRRRPLGRCTS
jgi:DNA-binding HxlR family transcriptional regulator